MKTLFALATAVVLVAPLSAMAGGHGRNCGCGAPEPTCQCAACAEDAGDCGCAKRCTTICLPKLNLPSLCDLASIFKCKKCACNSCQPACEPSCAAEPICAAEPTCHAARSCGCGHAKRHSCGHAKQCGCGLPHFHLFQFLNKGCGDCGCESEASGCGCGQGVEGEMNYEETAPAEPTVPDADSDVPPAPEAPAPAESTRYQRNNFRLEADDIDAPPAYASNRQNDELEQPASVRIPQNLRNVRSPWPTK